MENVQIPPCSLLNIHDQGHKDRFICLEVLMAAQFLRAYYYQNLESYSSFDLANLKCPTKSIIYAYVSMSEKMNAAGKMKK